MSHYAPNDGADIESGKLGRRISGHRYAELSQQLLPNEVLVGFYDIVHHKFAATLRTADDFDAFYKRYKEGKIIHAAYYAVPNSDVKDWL